MRRREFNTLLEYLKRTRGFDFDAYKRPSLMRRMRKRMEVVGVDGYGLRIVERVPIQIPPTHHNRRYLQTKKEKMGHLLDDVESGE